MDSIFRSFFGFQPRGSPTRQPEDNEHFSSLFTEDSDDDRDPLDSGVFLFTNPSDVFRQFDELFANFERAFQGFGTFQLPSIELIPGDLDPSSPVTPRPYSANPRDEMLKHPDSVTPVQPHAEPRTEGPARPHWFSRIWSTPSGRRDDDLDESVRTGGLEKIFGGNRDRELMPQTPQHSSVFQSVSVRTHRSADGKVEETRSMVDGEGNQQTIVTRTMNGQTIRQTTKKLRSGTTEVTEDLINMGEEDKEQFNERWNNRTRLNGQQLAPPSPRSEAIREPDTDYSDKSMFNRLFGFDLGDFRRA